MDYKEETLPLKRVDNKKWQFGDLSPKRVELAVLDYLKSEGWHGYFSEHFDFDHTLAVMMCFCNSDWYINGEVEPRDFDMPGGITADLPIRTIDCVFLFSKDGYFDFDTHHFLYEDLIGNAKSFCQDDIPKILKIWKDRNVSAPFIGMAHCSTRHASEIDEEALVSYFSARGGTPYFLDIIQRRFPKARQELLNWAKVLSKKLQSTWWPEFDLDDEGAVEAARVKLSESLNFGDDEAEANSLISDADYYLGVRRSAKEMPAVEAWIDQFLSLKRTPLTEEAIELAQDIGKYQALRYSNYEGIHNHAVLDLVIWKDKIGSVEVKSPNDKMRPHQVAQLIQDKKDGKISWVINVVEKSSIVPE